MNLSKFFSELLKINTFNTYDFNIKPNTVSSESETPNGNVLPSILYNLDFVKSKYSTFINSDIIIRDFTLNIKEKDYSAFLLYIDGMINSNSINDFVLKPLLLNLQKEYKYTYDNRELSTDYEFNTMAFIYGNMPEVYAAMNLFGATAAYKIEGESYSGCRNFTGTSKPIAPVNRNYTILETTNSVTYTADSQSSSTYLFTFSNN